MHQLTLVILPSGTDSDIDSVEAAVSEEMGPFNEENEDADVTFWDWYQIGGRWTGFLDGYDPETDESLLKLCDLCGGTGLRKPQLPDEVDLTQAQMREKMAWANGCNGCQGKGKTVGWATGFPVRAGDWARASTLGELTETPYGLVVDGDYYEQPSKELVDSTLKLAGDRLVVVVDSHS